MNLNLRFKLGNFRNIHRLLFKEFDDIGIVYGMLIFSYLEFMGGGGHIGAMISSLKNNNRRVQRDRLAVKELTTSSVKKLDVPTVSEFRRKEIVKKAMRKRRIIELIAYMTLFFLVISTICFFVWGV